MSLSINRYLDAAVLYPDLEREAARKAIVRMTEYGCRTVCLRPCDLAMGVDLCRGTDSEICIVLNFPHGCGLSRAKALEAQAYIDEGANEIDMVANYGLIRSEEWDLVQADIAAVAGVTGPRDVLLKVILETSELSREQIRQATECAIAAQADYVKTSTGFASGGATPEAVETMLEAARGRIRVKASGGIRTYEQALRYVDMGVERLGVGYTAVPAICGGAPSEPVGSQDY